MHALDATLWDEPTTGIGLYTHQLWRAMERAGTAPLRLGARRSGDAPRGRRRATVWTVGELPEVLRNREVSLYHAHGNFNLPLLKPAGTKFVLTVHDIIPDLLPDTVSFAFRTQFRVWLSRSLSLADRVVCVSEATRQALLAHYPVARERTCVVHNGVDHVLEVPLPDRAQESALQELELPEKFVLFAGSWDVRKNVMGLLAGWQKLPKESRVPLVLVGQSWFGSSPAEREVSSLRASGFDLRPLGYQPAPILYELMRRATVFAFPSLYEGFGLPPLEAMRLGTAAIVSNRGAASEVCGDSAVAVDPADPAALTAALKSLLTNSSERNGRREAGERWARAFSWERTARRTLEIYEEASLAPSISRSNPV